MAYSAWSVVAGEQPTAAKWNILGTNDASFNDGTGIAAGSFSSQHFATGVPVQIVSTNFSAVATGTTLIPLDDTIPQISEGTEFMTQAITPKSATNKLMITATIFSSYSVNTSNTIGALFQDATANALAAGHNFQGTATAPTPFTIVHTMVAGTTSATTFRIRLGGSSAGTVTFNGQAGTRQYGGATLSTLTVTEYKV